VEGVWINCWDWEGYMSAFYFRFHNIMNCKKSRLTSFFGEEGYALFGIWTWECSDTTHRPGSGKSPFCLGGREGVDAISWRFRSISRRGEGLFSFGVGHRATRCDSGCCGCGDRGYLGSSSRHRIRDGLGEALRAIRREAVFDALWESVVGSLPNLGECIRDVLIYMAAFS
jgi:hypothetical protein